MPDEWLTTNEAAEISGYSVQYVIRLLRQGKVKAQKFGHVWQVSRDSLANYIADSGVSTDGRRGPKKTQP